MDLFLFRARSPRTTRASALKAIAQLYEVNTQIIVLKLNAIRFDELTTFVNQGYGVPHERSLRPGTFSVLPDLQNICDTPSAYSPVG